MVKVITKYIVTKEFFMFGKQGSIMIIKLPSSLHFMLTIIYVYYAVNGDP